MINNNSNVVVSQVTYSIRFLGKNEFPSVVVEFPNKRWVASERTWGCQVLRLVGPPKSTRSSEGRDATFSRNPCTWQNDDVFGHPEYVLESGHIVLSV